jgi:hypothetical protein
MIKKAKRERSKRYVCIYACMYVCMYIHILNRPNIALRMSGNDQEGEEGEEQEVCVCICVYVCMYVYTYFK